MWSFLPRTRSRARWPFWLLLAAWFCANGPQSATYHVAVWLGEARHFSHQQRLTQGVVFALTGQQPTRAELDVKAGSSAKPFAPSIPTDAKLKKMELALDEFDALVPPPVRSLYRAERATAVVSRLRAQPLHSPPRSS